MATAAAFATVTAIVAVRLVVDLLRKPMQQMDATLSDYLDSTRFK